MSVSRRPMSEPTGEFENPVLSEVCSFCAHYDPLLGRRCSAFTYIPDQIWNGLNDHTSPFPGDQGIRFTPFTSVTLSDTGLS